LQLSAEARHHIHSDYLYLTVCGWLRDGLGYLSPEEVVSTSFRSRPYHSEGYSIGYQADEANGQRIISIVP
jgi:hypothetical protein